MARRASFCSLWWCVLFTLPLRADFAAGQRAYDRGDYASAVKEWRPLTEKGQVDAQFNLGSIYAHGQSVPQDYQEALRWYRLAAN